MKNLRDKVKSLIYTLKFNKPVNSIDYFGKDEEKEFLQKIKNNDDIVVYVSFKIYYYLKIYHNFKIKEF